MSLKTCFTLSLLLQVLVAFCSLVPSLLYHSRSCVSVSNVEANERPRNEQPYDVGHRLLSAISLKTLWSVVEDGAVGGYGVYALKLCFYS